MQTTVKAEKNPKYDTDPGKDTQDKVFLLSILEANKYFKSDTDRCLKATPHAKEKGAFVAGNGNSYWWLRSPGIISTYAAYVYTDGSVYEDGRNVDDAKGVVHPALWVKI